MSREVMLTTFEKSVKCFFNENGQLLRVNVIQDDVIQYYVLVKKYREKGLFELSSIAIEFSCLNKLT